MKVVAVVAQKGGVGKTTLTTELAVAAVQRGRKTLILDLDPQASAAVWGDGRAGQAPQVIGVQAPRLAVFLAEAARQGADLVLIDTAPNADSIALAAAKAADLVLIPAKPSPRDTEAISTTLRAVTDIAGKPHYVILNETRPRGTINQLAAEALRQAGVKLCPVQIGDRTAFVSALLTNKTATEYQPNSRAAAEIFALWDWLAAELGLRARKAVKPETRVGA